MSKNRIRLFENEITEDRLLTPKEAAAVLSISVKTVYAWGKRGILNRVKYPHCVRFLARDIEELVSRRRGL